ncbi:MAG: copper transporter, partial [Tepidanaerobacteraceae bacterium]
MLINIKYLVITVISIFLALGIGILIGIQIDSQDIILEQQEITVQRMENKLDELNRINLD